MSETLRADHLTRWKPGQAGGGHGRKPAAVRLAQLLASETQDGQEIIEFVLGVLRGKTMDKPNGKAKRGKSKAWGDKSRLWAAEWCADRLWGKAKQVIEFDTGGPAVQTNYDALSEDDLAALDRIMTKAMGERQDEPSPALQIPGEVIPIESDPDNE